MSTVVKLNETEFDKICDLINGRKTAADAALTRLILACGHKPKDKVIVGQMLYWKHFVAVCNDLLSHAYNVTEFGHVARTIDRSCPVDSSRGSADDGIEDSEWLDT